MITVLNPVPDATLLGIVRLLVEVWATQGGVRLWPAAPHSFVADILGLRLRFEETQHRQTMSRLVVGRTDGGATGSEPAWQFLSILPRSHLVGVRWNDRLPNSWSALPISSKQASFKVLAGRDGLCRDAAILALCEGSQVASSLLSEAGGAALRA